MTDRRSTAIRAGSNRRDSSSISSSVRSRSPSISPTFTQQFIDIIRQHKSHCAHIERLLTETQKSYEKINADGALIAESLIKIHLEPIDEDYLHSLILRPLALIICSPNYSGKVQFVNELFNVPLLPEESTIRNDEFIPMIRVQNYPENEFRLNTTGVLESIDSESIYQSMSWTTIPFHDLPFEKSQFVEHERSFIEIRRPFELLEEDVQLIIMPSNFKTKSGRLYAEIKKTFMPIFIYIINQNKLSDEDIEELRIFRDTITKEPILFIEIDQSQTLTNNAESSAVQVFKQLCDAGFLSFITDASTDTHLDENQTIHSDIIDHGLANQSLFLDYIRKHIDRLALRAVNILQTLHETCLEFFHASAFDLARDILITPTRLSYVRETEKNLYQSLIDLTDSKQKEIRKLILQALNEVRENLFDEVVSLEIPDVELTDQLTVKRVQDVQKCNNSIQEFVRRRVDEAIAIKLFDSINVLQDNYVGTLRRCLFSLEKNMDGDESELSATKALQEILRSAYQVNVAPPTNPGFFQILVDRMRELFRTFSWSPNPRIDQEFKHSVALNILNNLSEIKLAKSICSQLNDRLQMSHKNFGCLLNQLESRHLDRLKTTEDEQERVRKSYTPKFARLLLESTSLRDLIRYGLPKIGREVGRGHYGIVYEARDWANHRSCVVKSVVPHDDDNWQSLALEFHYCRRISEHPRIVKLIGSVIDYSDPDRVPVLLMMERLRRDLHAALKHHLEFSVRMRIALDVVEGLRYLHGLGLVHRDIKLNNVLLDEHDRAQLTDLGFCKPEVMMSGSVVGTPIHMAPELFSSKYDHNVDVYAFGILFWYICSNNVKLPANFETCSSKDVLWVAVKKGIRPERLNTFTDECWNIMTECWSERSSARPYLGEVQKKIQLILNPVPSPCENEASMLLSDPQTNEK